MGHGFYQFSPELYYNIFSSENGFKTKQVIIYVQYPDDSNGAWYEVADPKTVKTRVMLVNNNPTYLIVLAEKCVQKEIFATVPQQSDYQTLWSITDALKENRKPSNEGRLKFMYRKYTPKRIKIFIHNVYDLFTREKIVNEDLGKIDENHFKKMQL